VSNFLGDAAFPDDLSCSNSFSNTGMGTTTEHLAGASLPPSLAVWPHQGHRADGVSNAAAVMPSSTASLAAEPKTGRDLSSLSGSVPSQGALGLECGDSSDMLPFAMDPESEPEGSASPLHAYLASS
jgi:hypothetical protein